MGKKIFFIREQKTLSVAKGSSVKLSIALGTDVPSGDVTVTLDSTNGWFTHDSPLTFTPGNYLVPQTITLTGEMEVTQEGFKQDTLEITCSGGGYSSVVKNVNIWICDTGLDYQFLRGYSWYYDLKVKSLAQISTKRSALIDYVFNGAGLPTNDTPDDSDIGWTGTIGQFSHASLTGTIICDRLIWNKNDGTYDWPQITYHLKKAGNTYCAFVSGGHGSENNHLAICQDLLDNGCDVMYVFMPSTFQNEDTSPLVGTSLSGATISPNAFPGRGVAAHNDYKTGVVDNPGTFNAIEYFFYEKVMSYNYLKTNYSYTKYFITGCSGGGYTALLMAALIVEFEKCVPIRGVKPIPFRVFSDESGTASWDFEQGPCRPTNLIYSLNSTSNGTGILDLFTNITTFFDLMILASSGGRKVHMSNHAQDSCCLNKYTYNIWKDYFKSYANSLGCNFDLTLSQNGSYTTHGFNVNDRAIVLAEFV